MPRPSDESHRSNRRGRYEQQPCRAATIVVPCIYIKSRPPSPVIICPSITVSTVAAMGTRMCVVGSLCPYPHVGRKLCSSRGPFSLPPALSSVCRCQTRQLSAASLRAPAQCQNNSGRPPPARVPGLLAYGRRYPSLACSQKSRRSTSPFPIELGQFFYAPVQCHLIWRWARVPA